MNRTLAIFTAVAFLAVAMILAGSIPGTLAPVAPAITPAPSPTPVPETAFGSAFNTEAPAVAPDAAVPFTGAGGLQNVTLDPPDTLVIGAAWEGTYEASYEVRLANTTGSDVTHTFAIYVDGEPVGDTEAGILVPAGGLVTLEKRASIALPGGARVRLVNTGTDTAELTTTAGGRGAVLTLQRTGGLPFIPQSAPTPEVMPESGIPSEPADAVPEEAVPLEEQEMLPGATPRSFG